MGIGVPMFSPGGCGGCPSCPPPEIRQQPESVAICLGGEAELAVTVFGLAPIEYQWYQGESGDTSTPLEGETGDTLTVSPEEATPYWVRVSNPCGSADSDTATVTVNTAPEIVQQPEGGLAPAQLVVVAAGAPPLTYQWQYWDGSEWQDIPGETSPEYEADPETTTDYRVVVSNSCGDTPSDTATVIAAPADLTSYMNLDDQPEGDPVSFSNPGSAGGTWSSALLVASAGGPNGRKYVVNPDQDSRVSLAGVNGSDLVSIAGGGLIGGVCRINPSNCPANNNGGVLHLGVAFNLGSCNTGPRVQPAVWYDGLVQGPTVNVTAGQWFAFVFRWDPAASVFWFRINGGAWQSTSAPSGINGANTAIAFNGTRAGAGVTSAVDGTEYMTRLGVYSEAEGDAMMAYLCARCGLTD